MNWPIRWELLPEGSLIYYAQLLSDLGASLRHAMTLVEMEVRALLILKQLKVRVIVIDEVHNLLAGSPREQRVILQLFRHLSNELKASLVFLGIAEAREAIAGDTQLSRRLVPRHRGFDWLVLHFQDG